MSWFSGVVYTAVDGTEVGGVRMGILMISLVRMICHAAGDRHGL